MIGSEALFSTITTPEEEIKPTISNFSKLEGNLEENTSILDSKIEIEIEESKEEEIADVNNFYIFSIYSKFQIFLMILSSFDI